MGCYFEVCVCGVDKHVALAWDDLALAIFTGCERSTMFTAWLSFQGGIPMSVSSSTTLSGMEHGHTGRTTHEGLGQLYMVPCISSQHISACGLCGWREVEWAVAKGEQVLLILGIADVVALLRAMGVKAWQLWFFFAGAA